MARKAKEDEIRETLNASGFTKIQIFDAEKELSMRGQTGRKFFLATRRV